MSRDDDIAAAEMAALVGGHLRGVDSKMTQRSSTDAGAQVHPTQFLNNSKPQQQTTNTAVIPAAAMVEQPKSRSAGSEVVGTENVNLGDLMIPMDGADKEMREAIKLHSKAATSLAKPPTPNAPAPAKPVATPQPIAAPVATVPVTSEVVELLKEINEKLDILMKRAKIQPRYKKVKPKVKSK